MPEAVSVKRAGVVTKLAVNLCYLCNRVRFVRGHGSLRMLAEYLSSGRVCRVKRHGCLFDFYVGENDKIVDHSELYESWQPQTSKVIRQICRPGMTCVDVGANIGVFTMQLARRVGATGHVFALEPAPTFFARLRHHVEINKFNNVTADNLAASSHSFTGTMFEYAASASQSRVWDSPRNEVPFLAVSLDQHLRADRIDFIKSDTDGHELDVITGATETIMRHRPVLLVEAEVSPGDPDSLEKCRQLIARLLEMKYRIFTDDGAREYRSHEEVSSDWEQDVLCRPS